MPVEYHLPYTRPENQPRPHYYGDVVRRLFLAVGVVMLTTYPFFRDILTPLPVSLTMLAVLALAFFAGLLNPKQRWVTMLNLGVSAAGVLVFEYYGIKAYGQVGVDARHVTFFVANQVLALLFLAALYYSSKTVRGQYLGGKSIPE